MPNQPAIIIPAIKPINISDAKLLPRLENKRFARISPRIMSKEGYKLNDSIYLTLAEIIPVILQQAIKTLHSQPDELARGYLT
jgi:hypothetical protein